MCKTMVNYSVGQTTLLWPFQDSKHFVTQFCWIQVDSVGFSRLKLGKMIIQNAFKVIHWKFIKNEFQLITQLIKLQF